MEIFVDRTRLLAVAYDARVKLPYKRYPFTPEERDYLSQEFFPGLEKINIEEMKNFMGQIPSLMRGWYADYQQQEGVYPNPVDLSAGVVALVRDNLLAGAYNRVAPTRLIQPELIEEEQNRSSVEALGIIDFVFGITAIESDVRLASAALRGTVEERISEALEVTKGISPYFNSLRISGAPGMVNYAKKAGERSLVSLQRFPNGFRLVDLLTSDVNDGKYGDRFPGIFDIFSPQFYRRGARFAGDSYKAIYPHAVSFLQSKRNTT